VEQLPCALEQPRGKKTYMAHALGSDIVPPVGVGEPANSGGGPIKKKTQQANRQELQTAEGSWGCSRKLSTAGEDLGCLHSRYSHPRMRPLPPAVCWFPVPLFSPQKSKPQKLGPERDAG
jgi:hypothetical protein